jgi:cysteine synthase B
MEEGYIPPLLDFGLLDGRFVVDAAAAIACAREVAEHEGLLVGVSSGATLSAARRVAERMDSGNIVVIFADGGWKYLPARPWDGTASDAERLDEVHWW